MDVDALLDEPTVALRGPWGGERPRQDRAGGERSRRRRSTSYHLDFPGDALDPGCNYEHWARRITEGDEPTVYAHVATDPAHPGKLALQYWLFYAFNDWNNLHEGDWEMIQLVFDADDAAEALEREPIEVGYSQHEGAERADWGDDEARGRRRHASRRATRPRARTRTTSSQALYLGSSASQGVGCDDTTGPTIRPPTRVVARSRAMPPDDRRPSRGSASRAAGASCSRRSTTGRPGRT